MQRRIDEALTRWKASPYRKPLVIQGARQVGKTYAILSFGRAHYDNVAYFNFEADPTLVQTFSESIHPAYLLPILSHLSGQTIVRERTLVVFDEVQACERALTALKYFQEEAPEYHVIAAGSLLGVAVRRENYAFPVGKVDLLTMHPMMLDEFMTALGEDALVTRIRECFSQDLPLPVALHEAALKRYREYLIVGGMPECVAQYAQTQDLVLVRTTQDTILQSYLHDMSKYSSAADIRKTRLTFDSISVQLSKKNTRFQYKLIKQGGRAAEFEGAIEWLLLAGLVHKTYRVEQVRKPLEDYRDIDAFKIYMGDLGLLSAKNDLHPGDILVGSPELNDFKGGMAENYVLTHLAAKGYLACYWQSERGAEVDFVIQREGELIPIEVKSADNTQAKSLRVYMDSHQPTYAIKLSTKNFGLEARIKTVPLYAAFCL